MDIETIINYLWYIIQFILYGAATFLLWAFLGIAWKAKEEGSLFDKHWEDGWRFALLLFTLGFVVFGGLRLIGFNIQLADFF